MLKVKLLEGQRIPKGQSKMDNPEKQTTQGTPYEEKQNTICVGHHSAQTNIHVKHIIAQHKKITVLNDIIRACKSI